MEKTKKEELYAREYNYEEMKLAVFVESFWNLKRDEIEQKDLQDFEDYESIVALAVEIYDNWKNERDFGTLADNEYGYTQEYALRYMTDKYLK